MRDIRDLRRYRQAMPAPAEGCSDPVTMQ